MLLLIGVNRYTVLVRMVVKVVFLATEAMSDERPGYQCGDLFFTNQQVANVLFQAAYNLGLEHNSPQLVPGTFYENDQMYMIWPLKGEPLNKLKKETASPYYVYFDDRFHVIGVIAMLKNRHFMKCSKAGESRSALLTPIPWEAGRFQCGDQYFQDTELKATLLAAPSRSVAYTGSLFGYDIGARISPLILAPEATDARDKVYDNTYHIVTDQNNNLLGVVAETIDSNFLKCSRLFMVAAPKFGYQCKKIFFEREFLEEHIKVARERRSSRFSRLFPYPQKVLKSGGDELRWPLSNVKDYPKKVKYWPYFAMMTRNFELIGLKMMYSPTDLYPCTQREIKAQDYYNDKALNCGGKIFWEQQLNRAARLGCETRSFKI